MRIVFFIAFHYRWQMRALALVLSSLHLAGCAARAANLDPGRPEVAELGRQILR